MNYLEKLFSLEGKNSIITGAALGNGRAISEALFRAGSNVLLVDKNSKDLEKAKNEIKEISFSKNHEVLSCDCDVSDEKQVLRIRDVFERVDILVNNAGVTIGADFLDYAEDDWDLTFNVNLKAPFRIMQIIAPLMPPGSSIINITSLNSELGFPGNPAYAASKGALKQLTKAAAIDLSSSGIRVNNVGPGYMKTAMTLKSWENPSTRNERSSRTILGRWGMPEDLAGAVIFLASEASGYVTGQDIYVDGGWIAKGL
jgi:NAD(P)-dependent dehydrogenase (short-subunit alcohol dehydrogenase family)